MNTINQTQHSIKKKKGCFYEENNVLLIGYIHAVTTSKHNGISTHTQKHPNTYLIFKFLNKFEKIKSYNRYKNFFFSNDVSCGQS